MTKFDMHKVYQNFSGLTKEVIDKKKVRKLFDDAVENGATPATLMAIAYFLESKLSSIISESFIMIGIEQRKKRKAYNSTKTDGTHTK